MPTLGSSLTMSKDLKPSTARADQVLEHGTVPDTGPGCRKFELVVEKAEPQYTEASGITGNCTK